MEDNRRIVIITDLRTKEARDAASYLAGLGYDVRPVPEDIPLWDEEALRNWAQPFAAELRGVIHPAPPFLHGGIEEVTEEQWDKNSYEGPVAALIVTKVFGMILRESGKGGAIIYLNSIHAEKPAGKGLLFSIACGAVQMLNREINQDYGEFNVNTYFVQRGPTVNDPDGKSDISSLYYGVDLRYPQRKMPEEGYLNGLLAFLLTDAAAPLAGSDLRADGGFVGYYGHRRKVEGRPYPDWRAKANQAARRDEKASQSADAEAGAQEPQPAEEEKRVALVTGSGKGVGAGVIRVLTRHGIRCCINCNSNPAMAEKLLEEVQSYGGEAFVYQADITKPEQLRGMVQAIIERYGRLDILVNNAAMQPNKYVDQYTAEEFRKLWEINIGGYFHATRECLPYLKQSPKPRIVNVSSIHGKRPTSFDSGYAMTKGAIRMFTRELAMEVYQFGGRANTIDLGGCKIEFKTGGFGMESYRSTDTFNPDIKDRFFTVFPEDVGQMVWYLANDTGDGINGAGIRIDRGLALS